jgi:15-cis-phytoene synthase
MSSRRAGLLGARAALAAGSRSFDLASRLLPRSCRDDAAVVYAFCRRADDRVDEAPPEQVPAALALLRREVRVLFSGADPGDPLLRAFQEVAARRAIPQGLVTELIAGFAMDARPVPIVYQSWDQLLLYCFRVAGTVGLMMCRLMDLRDGRAARHAAALGIAMQLTNIARDVAEDWGRGRLYLPRESLGPAGADLIPQGPLHPGPAALLSRAVRLVLDTAQPFYRWGDAALAALDRRSAIAVRAARLVYSAIGDRLAARGCDVTGPRVVVPGARKLGMVVRAWLEVTGQRLWRRRPQTWKITGPLPPLPGPLPIPFLLLPETPA